MKYLHGCLLMLLTSIVFAANPPEEMKLWASDPPNVVEGAGMGEPMDNGTRMTKVGIPGMWIHYPAGEGKDRPAFIVCPGGGYVRQANYQVGNGVVPQFLPKNVVVIVLKYRLAPPSPNVERDALDDAKRAVRLVRHHAKEWGIDPRKVGVLGWSAGANLTLNLASHFDNGKADADDPVERESSRPDFVGLFCPWPAKRTIADYPIAADAPPAFIASAKDDQTAPTTFAEAIYASYRAAGVPSRFWQIDTGGHRAFTYGSAGEGMQWPAHFWDWLVQMWLP